MRLHVPHVCRAPARSRAGAAGTQQWEEAGGLLSSRSWVRGTGSWRGPPWGPRAPRPGTSRRPRPRQPSVSRRVSRHQGDPRLFKAAESGRTFTWPPISALDACSLPPQPGNGCPDPPSRDRERLSSQHKRGSSCFFTISVWRKAVPRKEAGEAGGRRGPPEPAPVSPLLPPSQGRPPTSAHALEHPGPQGRRLWAAGRAGTGAGTGARVGEWLLPLEATALDPELLSQLRSWTGRRGSSG